MPLRLPTPAVSPPAQDIHSSMELDAAQLLPHAERHLQAALRRRSLLSARQTALRLRSIRAQALRDRQFLVQSLTREHHNRSMHAAEQRRRAAIELRRMRNQQHQQRVMMVRSRKEDAARRKLCELRHGLEEAQERRDAFVIQRGSKAKQELEKVSLVRQRQQASRESQEQQLRANIDGKMKRSDVLRRIHKRHGHTKSVDKPTTVQSTVSFATESDAASRIQDWWRRQVQLGRALRHVLELHLTMTDLGKLKFAQMARLMKQQAVIRAESALLQSIALLARQYRISLNESMVPAISGKALVANARLLISALMIQCHSSEILGLGNGKPVSQIDHVVYVMFVLNSTVSRMYFKRVNN